MRIFIAAILAVFCIPAMAHCVDADGNEVECNFDQVSMVEHTHPGKRSTEEVLGETDHSHYGGTADADADAWKATEFQLLSPSAMVVPKLFAPMRAPMGDVATREQEACDEEHPGKAGMGICFGI